MTAGAGAAYKSQGEREMKFSYTDGTVVLVPELIRGWQWNSCTAIDERSKFVYKLKTS